MGRISTSKDEKRKVPKVLIGIRLMSYSEFFEDQFQVVGYFIQLMFLFDGLDDSYYFDTGPAHCLLCVLLIKLMEKETVLAIDDLLFIVFS